MSFALVVVATITLVVGLLQSGLTLIYVSIGCSVLAGLVLAIAVLRGRPEAAPAAAPRAERVPAAAGAPTAAGGGPSTPPPPSGGRPWETAGAGEATTPSGWSAPPPPEPEPEPEPEREPEYAGLGSRPWASDRTEQIDVAEVGPESDGEFPIQDYDRLRASEILRLLPDLPPDDLQKVRQREVAGMNRFTVISRIDAQLETAASGDWGVTDQEWAVPAEEATAGAPDVAAEEVEPEEEPPEPEPPAVPLRGRRTAKAPARRSRRRPLGTVEEPAAEPEVEAPPAEEPAPPAPAPTRRGRAKAAPVEVEAAPVTKRAGGRRAAAKKAAPVEKRATRRPPARATEAEPAAPKRAGGRKAAGALGAAEEPVTKRAGKKAAARKASPELMLGTAPAEAPGKRAASKKAAKAAKATKATKKATKATKALKADKAPGRRSPAPPEAPVKKASRARKSPGI